MLIVARWPWRKGSCESVGHEFKFAYLICFSHVPDIVVDVAAELIIIFYFTAEAIHLGPAGNTGFEKTADHVLTHDLGAFIGVDQHMGPGANDRRSSSRL